MAGPAFDTLDTPWLSDLCDVLAQERVTAQLDRNDIQLSRGRHAELIAGLIALTAEHPLDERLAGQYMLALYRSGRPPSALAVYRDIHDRLAEELGTSPHPSLQDLHQEILRSSPPLAVSPAAPAPAFAHTRGDLGSITGPEGGERSVGRIQLLSHGLELQLRRGPAGARSVFGSAAGFLGAAGVLGVVAWVTCWPRSPGRCG